MSISPDTASLFLLKTKQLRRRSLLRASILTFAVFLVCLLAITLSGVIIYLFGARSLSAIQSLWQIGILICFIAIAITGLFVVFTHFPLSKFIRYYYNNSSKDLDSYLTAYELSLKVYKTKKLSPETESGNLALLHIQSVSTANPKGKFFASNRRIKATIEIILLLVTVSFSLHLFWPEKAGTAFSFSVSPLIEALASSQSQPGVTLLNDISLSYQYPAYANLPPQTFNGTDGTVEALKGTRVNYTASVREDVSSGWLLLPDAKKISVTIENDNKISVSFVIEKGGVYHFEFKQGFSTVRERDRLLALVPDQQPKIKMQGPDGFPENASEIVVSGKEKLLLSFQAEDDFGITQVKLVFGKVGEKKSETIVADNVTSKRYSNSMVWDIAGISGTPGERIPFYFSALDNDTISGPKEGTSQVKYLKFFSQSDFDNEREQKARALWEKLVATLSRHLTFLEFEPNAIHTNDELKKTISFSKALLGDVNVFLSEKPIDAVSDAVSFKSELSEEITSAFKNLVSDLQKDLSAFEGLYYPDEEANKKVENYWLFIHSNHVKHLENHTLYLEDLLDRSRLKNLLSRLNDIDKQYSVLQERLEKLQKSGDQKLREELISEIERLKNEMAKLMSDMAMLQKIHEDEFMNMRAEMEKKFGDWQKLSELIREGDLNKAAKELEELGKMMADLRRALSGKMGTIDSQYKELMEEFVSTYSKLEEAIRKEEQILGATRQISEEQRKEMDKALQSQMKNLKDKIKQLIDDISADVEKFPEKLPSRIEEMGNKSSFLRSTKSLRDLVEVDDYYASREEARKLRDLFDMLWWSIEENMGSQPYKDLTKRVSHAREKSIELLKLIEKLLSQPKNNLSSEELAEVARLSKSQREVKNRVNEISRDLNQLTEKMPALGREGEKELQEASRAMDKAEGKLSGRDVIGAETNENEALSKLNSVKQGLERMIQKGGSGSGGFPMPYAMRGSGSGNEREEGMMGNTNDREKVKIPSPEEFKAPKEFREELLKGMKLPAPEEYQKPVKQYFEELLH